MRTVVASTIKNFVANFKTVGVRKFINELDSLADAENRVEQSSSNVNKQITRQGRSSESAARSFSAQAQGLGGLVAAYAGAAATAYALQAAFDALSRSARFEQTISGLNALAFAVGETGESVTNSIRQITKNQLTLSEAASQASLSLSAGFDLSQISGLTEVSLKASRALGRDLTDAMTRVVRGSAKMETELLDELGIYTKIGPATRAYAAAIGKTVTELTEYERRQAFVNSVIEEGNRKFSVINTTLPTASEKLAAFGTKLLDVGTQLGSLLANVFAPLASFLTNNLSGSFAAVGLAFSLISGKAVVELIKGLDALSAGIDRTADKWEARMLSMTRFSRDNAAKISKSLQDPDLMMGLSDKDTESLTALRKKASKGVLGYNSIRESQVLLTKSTSTLSEELDKQVAKIDNLQKKRSSAKSPAVAAGLDKQISEAQRGYNDINKALGKNAEMFKLIGQRNNSVWAKAGRGISLVTSKTLGLGTTLGHAVSNIVSLTSKLALVGSLAVGAGAAIAGLMGKQEEYNAILSKGYQLVENFFVSLSSKSVGRATSSLAAEALTDLQKVDKELQGIKEFTFTKKTVLGIDIEITKTKEDLVREVSDALTIASEGLSMSDALLDPTTWLASWRTTALGVGGAIVGVLGGPLGIGAGAAIGASIGAALEAKAKQKEALETIGGATKTSLEAQYGSDLFKGDSGRQTAIALAQLEKTSGEYKNLSFSMNKYYKTQQDIIVSLKGQIDNLKVLEKLASNLGTTVADIKNKYDVMLDAFNNTVLKPKVEIPGSLDVEIRVINEEEALAAIEKFKEVVGKSLKGEDTIETGFFSALFSTDRNAAATALEDLRAAEKAIDRLSSQSSLTDIGKSSLNFFTKQAEEAKATLRDLGYFVEDYAVENVNKIADLLTKSFSGSTQLSDELLILNNSFTSMLSTVNSGGATLENLSQFGNIQSKSLERYAIALRFVDDAISSLNDERAAVDSDSEAAKILDEQLLRLNSLREVNNANYENIKKQVIEQEELLKPLVEQLTLQEEIAKVLDDKTKKAASLVEVYDDQLGILTTSEEKEKSLLRYAVKNASENLEAYNTRRQQLQDITAMTEQLKNQKLTQDQINKLTSATSAEAKDLVTNYGLAGTELGNMVEKAIKLVPADLVASDNAEKSLNAIQNLALDVYIEVTKAAEKAVSNINKIASAAEKELKDLQSDKVILTLEFEADKIALQNKINSSIAEFKIDKLEAEIELIEAKTDNKKISPLASAEQINAKEQEILVAKKELIMLEALQAFDELDKKEQLITEENKIAINQIKSEGDLLKSKIKAEKAAVMNLVTAYASIFTQMQDIYGNIVIALVQSGNDIGAAIVSAMVQGAKAAGLEGVTEASFVPVAPTAEFKKIDSDFGLTLRGIEESALAAENTVTDLVAERTKAQELATSRALELLELERDGVLLNAQEKLELAEIQAQIEAENAEQRITDAKASGEAQKDAFEKAKKALLELHEAIAGPIKSAIMGLNDFIVYGEGSIKDVFANMFKSIQQNMFETYVAEPLSTGITDSILGMFGIAPKRTLENAKVGADGALLVRMAGPLLDIQDDMTSAGGGIFGWFTSLFGKKKQAEDEQKQGATSLFGSGGMLSSLFTNLFGQGGFLSNLLSGIFGADGLLSSLLQGIGSILTSTGSGGSSIIGSVISGIIGGGTMAAGGAVQQFAAGGGVQKLAAGSLVRDRVPAMLEPGEFVIRKPAARKIGAPALQELNATGRLGGSAGNIQVNVNNEGSAKSAEVSQPKFDGEKYVIDIITRDLSNNGPIRRSLRGNR